VVSRVTKSSSAAIAARKARKASAQPKVGFVSLGCPKALVDSELPVDQAKSLLPNLITVEALWRWDVYHLIGDALRDQSDQANLALNLVRSVARKLDH